MTENDFIAMARSYGLRASEPVKYGEHNYDSVKQQPGETKEEWTNRIFGE